MGAVDEEGAVDAQEATRAPQTRAALVHKKVTDNFPGWASEQADGHIVDGYSLRPRLEHDFALVEANDRRRQSLVHNTTMGQRSSYAKLGSAIKQLVVASKAELVDGRMNIAL